MEEGVMRTRPIFIVILAVLGLLVQRAAAQDDDGFDRLMTKKRISCADIEENARFLIPGYHSSGRMDSIRYLLRYWERNCGNEEAITRMTLILDAEAGILDSYPFSRRTIWNLRDFKRKSLFAKENPDWKSVIIGNSIWGEQDKVNDPFDLFTSVLAQDIRSRSERAFDVQLLTFYGGDLDSLFSLLSRKGISNTALQSSYDSVVTEVHDMYTYDMAAVLGVIRPNRRLSIIGTHPETGFSFGVSRRRWNGEVVLALRFVTAATHYVVVKDGIPVSTRHYAGAYIGAHTAYDVIQSRRHDLFLTAGVAYDEIEAIPPTSSKATDDVSLGSLNLNLGAGVRWYMGSDRSGYLSAELRYNNVAFPNPGGSDLTGDLWSVRLAYHFSDDWKYQLLRSLGATE